MHARTGAGIGVAFHLGIDVFLVMPFTTDFMKLTPERYTPWFKMEWAHIRRNFLDALLKRTKDLLPDVKLIIGEPFAVTGTSAVTPAGKLNT